MGHTWGKFKICPSNFSVYTIHAHNKSGSLIYDTEENVSLSIVPQSRCVSYNKNEHLPLLHT